MARVDFYVLAKSEETDPQRFACRLVEKAFRAGHQIYIQVGSNQEAKSLDELLWTFRQGSFVPHKTIDGNQPSSAPDNTPVLIGHTEPPPTMTDVLVNLGQKVPATYALFQRVAEIVPAQGERKTWAREHFRFYREQGCEVHSHEVGNQ